MTLHAAVSRLARRSSAHAQRDDDGVPPAAVADLAAAHAAAGPAALAAAAAQLRGELAGGAPGAAAAFAALRSLQARLDARYPCAAAEAASDLHLNRYSDVLPYDHSRVRLDPENEDAAAAAAPAAGPCADYINASLVECADPVTGAAWSYIAAQGPLPHTAAAFWRMVAQRRAPAVAMLTALVEGRRRKCHPYFADAAGETMELGEGLRVRTLACGDAGLGLVWRRVRVEAPGGGREDSGLPWACDHYQFTSWPDHGVPRSPAPILALSALLRGGGGAAAHGAAGSSQGPFVVHCSAGIGRSGVFCVLDSAARRLVGAAAAADAEAAAAAARSAVDVAAAVEALRHQRAGMVQTVDQLAFCHTALLALVEAAAAAGATPSPPPPQ